MWLGFFFCSPLSFISNAGLAKFFVVHTQPAVLSHIYVHMEKVYLLIPYAADDELLFFDNLLI